MPVFQYAVAQATMWNKSKTEETRKLPTQRILRNIIEYLDIL